MPFSQEWKDMKETLQGLQEGTYGQSRNYNFEELCLYPFDKETLGIPFPPYFDPPKFEKYKGKGDLRENVKYFFMNF